MPKLANLNKPAGYAFSRRIGYIGWSSFSFCCPSSLTIRLTGDAQRCPSPSRFHVQVADMNREPDGQLELENSSVPPARDFIPARGISRQAISIYIYTKSTSVLVLQLHNFMKDLTPSGIRQFLLDKYSGTDWSNRINSTRSCLTTSIFAHRRDRFIWHSRDDQRDRERSLRSN